MRTTAGPVSIIAALLLAPILLIGLLVGGAALINQPGATVDRAKIPPLAADLLPELERLIATSCPDLPVPWAVALAQVESSWNPQAFNPDGRAAGLFQMTEPSWTAAGGAPWPQTPPAADSDIMQPLPHLQHAIPWICDNLRTVTAHVTATRKPIDPLDALLVCHIAGCGRVLESASGTPTAGEAGCDAACARTIGHYISTVHDTVTRFTAPAGPVPINDLPRPTAFAGSSRGCVEPDPQGRGCLTPAMRHVLDQLLATFGPLRSLTCWDEHAWNPDSDHPHGRACDLFPARPGEFPTGDALVSGWRMASWLRAHARDLKIRYVIWQGRFWSPTTPDRDGWGRPYTGGGIYDVQDPTGGHYDHIHVSVARE
ncbi:transglycosylase SLT domain-containing protein [Pseudonocardia nigra]|uniref:transglycosylase SLT domain-containing protein n=1 Tax=Pseudonocardia nigra TaxID=1921578 RepID=UPI001C5F4EA4|nr:transglycosylase SLT domain-containing protein [Pseudonocardia nigra]